jgi:hypothetical protein
VEMPGVSERTFSRCGDRLRGEGPEGLGRQAADQGPSAHGACPARAGGREDPAPAGNAMGLHREASSRGAATAAPSQEAAAAASLMVGIMLHRPRESGRRLALRMAAGRSSFALAEAIEQHGLFCELDTDRGSHCLHTQGRGGGIGDLVFLAFFVRRARHLLSAFGRLCGGGIPRGSESIPATPPPSWPPYRSPILEGRSILAPCHGGAPAHGADDDDYFRWTGWLYVTCAVLVLKKLRSRSQLSLPMLGGFLDRTAAGRRRSPSLSAVAVRRRPDLMVPAGPPDRCRSQRRQLGGGRGPDLGRTIPGYRAPLRQLCPNWQTSHFDR